MYLNQFSVVVPEGKENSGGYVEMEHNKQYTLRLRNDRGIKCDAYVEVDGKHIGTWRLEGGQNAVIEHPAHDQGRFTFYRLDSAEASQAGLVGNPNLGLIKVTFTPQVVRIQPRPLQPEVAKADPLPFQPIYPDVIYRGGSSSKSIPMSYSDTRTRGMMSAGGTGLSGHSAQQFGVAQEIELDYSQQTVIHLRLVAASNEPRPLTQYSSPIPPPII